MKYVFRFIWAVVFLFIAFIGIAAAIQSPGKIEGYLVLAIGTYFGVGFHQLISAHYPKQTYLYETDNKSFWLGWVLMMMPCLAFWRAYEVFRTHTYAQDLSKTRRGWSLDAATNWLGDTFGYGVPAAVYLVIGIFLLLFCIKLLKNR